MDTNTRTNSASPAGWTPLASAAFTLAEIAAQRHPELASRADRAAALVANGEITCVDTALYRCHGYTVDTAEHTCECADWRSDRAPVVGRGKVCKHLLAALTFERLNRQPEPAPIAGDHLAYAYSA
jgi:hypothetical protein